MRKIYLAILLVPALAWGQPRTASEWYQEGANQYNLSNLDKAIEAFKQAFALETDESKKPTYLYNIAQAYRLANDCKNALFFYKRYLGLSDSNPGKPLSPQTRKNVEGWIHDAEECVQKAASFSKKSPDTLRQNGDSEDTPPSAGSDGQNDPQKDVATGTDDDDDDDDVDGGSITRPARLAGPHVISARVTGGGTKISAGTIPVPVQFTAALVAGYPIAVNDKLTIDAGGAFTFTPVPYTVGMSGTERSETAQLIGLMANAGVTYEVIPKLGLRGDLGLGALFFANVGESRFTGGNPTSGALTMFHLRAALSADYAFTPNLVGTLTPIAFSYSPPKEGLASEIERISSIDFMLGIGYRM
jgi:hypothetical protein